MYLINGKCNQPNISNFELNNTKNNMQTIGWNTASTEVSGKILIAFSGARILK